jgi:hypothetical protein
MLKDQLLIPGRRGAVVDDCVALVDEQVASKSGLSGLAVKGAYAVVKAVKPGFIREVVDHLLDEFVSRLEPFHAAAVDKGGDVVAYFGQHQSEIADALLGVTDARAEHVKQPAVKKTYEKLRPTAKKHVEGAVPGVARILARHGATAAA